MLDATEASSDAPDDDTDRGRQGDGDQARARLKRSAPNRSTVVFPYTHLEDALTVAQVIHEGAIPLNRAQIAGLMHADPTSGGFSLKVGSARTFRLIEAIDGRYKVTDLGERMLSPDDTEARRARREAFLTVELYQKVFEAYRNKPLPSRPVGLENTFVQFGVAPKQKDKARLAFERSAQFAGFFHAGKERLVEPIIADPSAPNGRQGFEPPPVADVTETPTPTVSRPEQQPLIKGLLERMPVPDTSWPLDERVRWLRVLAANLAMIYGEKDEADIVIQPPTKSASNVPAKTASTQSVPKTQPLKATHDVALGGDLDDEIPF